MRPPIALTVVVVTLLLFSPLLPKLAAAQPSQGNWVVTGTQVVQNESITLAGNLTVQSGGNLTLKGVTLSEEVNYDGEFGIFVQPGGSMYIFNSVIEPSDPAFRYTFTSSGANLVIENSTLEGAGWCPSNVPPPNCGIFQPLNTEGIWLNTSNARVIGSTISDGGVGLILSAPRAVVTNDTFASNDVADISIVSGGCCGVQNFWSNDSIRNNYIDHALRVDSNSITLWGASGNTITGNNLTFRQVTPGVSVTGFFLNDAWNNDISGNTINAQLPIALLDGSSNDVMDNNTFFHGGVELQDGKGNQLEDNTLVVRQPPTNASTGIATAVISFFQYNETVVDNSIQVSKQAAGYYSDTPPYFGGGIDAVHTIDSLILNNNFSVPAYGPPNSFYDATNDTISGNIFVTPSIWSNYSVILYNSRGNTFTGNYVSGPASIAVYNSTSNVINGNDFVDNGYRPIDYGSNEWSGGGTGNYWSDYGGGPTYAISPNGTDTHPSTSPFPVSSAPVPQLRAVPLPSPLAGRVINAQISNQTLIQGASLELSTGDFPLQSGGNLTISNSSITGDLLISVPHGASVTIENSRIDWITGGVYVNGGTLRVINSTLVVGQEPPLINQISWIQVEDNGVLYIEGSSIQGAPDGYGWAIQNLVSNATIVIKNSTLSGGTTTYDTAVSLRINGPNSSLVLESTTFKDTAYAGTVFLPTDSARIINCTFVGDMLAIPVEQGQTAVLENNRAYGILFPFGANVPTAQISGNTITLCCTLLPLSISKSESSTTTTTQTTASVTTTLSKASGSTSTTSAETSGSNAGAGGVPEFPHQPLVAVAFVLIVAVGYLLIRQRHASG